MTSYSRHTRKHSRAVVSRAAAAFEDQLAHLFPVLLLLPAMWKFSSEELLRLFVGLSIAPSQAHSSCGSSGL